MRSGRTLLESGEDAASVVVGHHDPQVGTGFAAGRGPGRWSRAGRSDRRPAGASDGREPGRSRWQSRPCRRCRPARGWRRPWAAPGADRPDRDHGSDSTTRRPARHLGPATPTASAPPADRTAGPRPPGHRSAPRSAAAALRRHDASDPARSDRAGASAVRASTTRAALVAGSVHSAPSATTISSTSLRPSNRCTGRDKVGWPKRITRSIPAASDDPSSSRYPVIASGAPRALPDGSPNSGTPAAAASADAAAPTSGRASPVTITVAGPGGSGTRLRPPGIGLDLYRLREHGRRPVRQQRLAERNVQMHRPRRVGSAAGGGVDQSGQLMPPGRRPDQFTAARVGVQVRLGPDVGGEQSALRRGLIRPGADHRRGPVGADHHQRNR